jgi:hypothetical protein
VHRGALRLDQSRVVAEHAWALSDFCRPLPPGGCLLAWFGHPSESRQALTDAGLEAVRCRSCPVSFGPALASFDAIESVSADVDNVSDGSVFLPGPGRVQGLEPELVEEIDCDAVGLSAVCLRGRNRVRLYQPSCRARNDKQAKVRRRRMRLAKFHEELRCVECRLRSCPRVVHRARVASARVARRRAVAAWVRLWQTRTGRMPIYMRKRALRMLRAWRVRVRNAAKALRQKSRDQEKNKSSAHASHHAGTERHACQEQLVTSTRDCNLVVARSALSAVYSRVVREVAQRDGSSSLDMDSGVSCCLSKNRTCEASFASNVVTRKEITRSVLAIVYERAGRSCLQCAASDSVRGVFPVLAGQYDCQRCGKSLLG